MNGDKSTHHVRGTLHVNVNNSQANNAPNLRSANGGRTLAASVPTIAPQQMVAVTGGQTLTFQQRPTIVATPNILTAQFPNNVAVGRSSHLTVMNGTVQNPPILSAVTLPTVTMQRPAGSPVSIPAVQIRIGSRSFKPVNDIQIKDEGILFTLKDYPNAPVLLNARALIQCRMCTGPQLPSMYLHLEASCMKQIKSIFKIQDLEFSESHSGLRKYISIFPSEIQQHDMAHIRSLFMTMVQKFHRTDHILQEITYEQALDIHFDSFSSSNIVAAATSARPAVRAPRPQTAQRPVAPNNTAQQSSAATAMSSNSPSVASAPIITVPTNQADWFSLQKTLVNGTVYRVKQHGAAVKLCLWDGKALQPCVVHNTEVQLHCTHVRIGSFKAPSTDMVRVKNDVQRSGLQLKFKLPKGTEQEVFIQRDEIESSLVCLESTSTPCMFIYPNTSCTARLRNVLEMRSSNKDPYFSTTSKEERHKHVVLFLKDVNRGQRTALLEMGASSAATSTGKDPPGKRHQKQLFEEIDLLRALKILSGIKMQSKITDHFNGNNAAGSNAIRLEQIAKELQEADEATNDADDDDDDDLIMTSEEVGYKCPYTQKVMKEPVKNKHCGHNYEREAIQMFIDRKKGVAKCPYAGCGNSIPLVIDDLSLNKELQEIIRKEHLA